MSTGNIKTHIAFLVAYLASFIILLIIFLAAMYTQDRFLDVEYLKYAVVRMIVNHHAKLTRESGKSTLKSCHPGIV